MINCPICGSVGTLAAENYTGEVTHSGRLLTVKDLFRSRCSACNADPVMTDQIRHNQVLIADAKRRSDGLLTGDDIRRVRERLGLSQSAAANVFGGGGNAFSKYERGEVLQSFPMDRLLRLSVDLPAALSLLASYSDETPTESHMISNKAAHLRDTATLINQQVVPQPRIRKTG